MKLKILARSIKGKNHQVNQDSLWAGLNQFQNGLLIIADGVGSYDHSQLASKIVIEIIVDNFKKKNFNRLSKDEIHAWGEHLIQHIIQAKLQKINYKVATTLTFMIISHQIGYWFHIGNTRLYFYDQKAHNFWQVTKDHNFTENIDNTFSWLQGKRMLQNSLSNFNTCYFDFGTISLTAGYLLLSSDGLHDFVNNLILKNTFRDTSLTLAAKHEFLINKALFQGSLDDISVIFTMIS